MLSSAVGREAAEGDQKNPCHQERKADRPSRSGLREVGAWRRERGGEES